MRLAMHFTLAILALGGISPVAFGQDATQGAMVYMRLANDTRACVSCHGPDPGQNPNNILRAADNPDTLAKVMNTVGAMGFLSSQLTETDRANVTAFLGNIVRINDPTAPLKVWPVTMDFGTVPTGQRSARQFVRLTNPSASVPVPISSVTTAGAMAVLQNECPASLPAGEACEVGIQLQPALAGLQRGAVVLNSPALARPLVVAFSGYGSTGHVSALDWQAAVKSLRLEAPADGSQVRQVITLSNPGPMPALLGSTSITGPNASQFRVLGGCTSGSVLQAGTQCDQTIGFVPGALAEAKAVLQLRSDQGNPPAIRLDGFADTRAPQTVPAPLPAQQSGGGCSMGPPDSKRIDPLLWLMTLLALGFHLGRTRRGNRR